MPAATVPDPTAAADKWDRNTPARGIHLHALESGSTGGRPPLRPSPAVCRRASSSRYRISVDSSSLWVAPFFQHNSIRNFQLIFQLYSLSLSHFACTAITRRRGSLWTNYYMIFIYSKDLHHCWWAHSVWRAGGGPAGSQARSTVTTDNNTIRMQLALFIHHGQRRCISHCDGHNSYPSARGGGVLVVVVCHNDSQSQQLIAFSTRN